MNRASVVFLAILFLVPAVPVIADEAPLSEASEECMECHGEFHSGIVADWLNSRHAQTTPARAMAVRGLERKLSSKTVPKKLADTSVGCAECHTVRPDKHKDTFEHNGYRVHVVVSPDDCATCHIEERTQYADNLMAHARKNLLGNDLYNDLQRQTSGTATLHGDELVFETPDALTQKDSCVFCHGTELKVTGFVSRDTDVGELTFPHITGWPNQGVGRKNLDGSLGACTACHPRHTFSMEMARKPYTCKECHVGPDVPAFKVYMTSKHGNIFSSHQKEWDFNTVPWTVGDDFGAPTCATCHISLVVNSGGDILANRSHRMTDRLANRIFGLPYAHRQPLSPDTTLIRNKDGLPLPTAFDGTPASQYLIDGEERATRTQAMQTICRACHDQSWVKGHWAQYRNTIATTNATTRTATKMIQWAWDNGVATNPARGGSYFDEAVERRWMDIWLFYANTARFASAMGGGGDYGAFADGRYQLNQAVSELYRATMGRPHPKPMMPMPMVEAPTAKAVKP